MFQCTNRRAIPTGFEGDVSETTPDNELAAFVKRWSFRQGSGGSKAGSSKTRQEPEREGRFDSRNTQQPLSTGQDVEDSQLLGSHHQSKGLGRFR